MLMVMVHDDVTLVWTRHLAALKLPMYQDCLHGGHKQTRDHQQFQLEFSYFTYCDTACSLSKTLPHLDSANDGLQSKQWDVHPKALSISKHLAS